MAATHSAVWADPSVRPAPTSARAASRLVGARRMIARRVVSGFSPASANSAVCSTITTR